MIEETGGSALQGASNINGPCREKYWDEMTDAQKIQKLREVVIWMGRDLQDARETIATMSRHQHAQDGTLLAPIPLSLSMHEPGDYKRQYARGLLTERERGR